MSKGLTYKADAEVVITIAGDEVDSPDYEEAVTNNDDGTTTVTWTISAAQMTAMNAGDTVVVTYHATVNTDASIDGTEMNAVVIQYSEQEVNGVPVEINTTWFGITKVDTADTSKTLKGAQFELYREGTDTQVAVNITKMTETEAANALGTKTPSLDEEGNQEYDDNGLPVYTITPGTPDPDTVYYKVDTASTSNVIDMTDYAKAAVYGLDEESTYYLTEIVAPDGYNLPKDQFTITLGEENEFDIPNDAGTVLPSTGGIGTTIFYVIGGLMAVGAGVVLVTKKRMSKEEN